VALHQQESDIGSIVNNIEASSHTVKLIAPGEWICVPSQSRSNNMHVVAVLYSLLLSCICTTMAHLPADAASAAQRSLISAKNATTSDSAVLNSTRFDPYSSAFSKKASSTRQKRAEQAVLELRAKRQQILLSFDSPNDRNITVLTPNAAAVVQADATAAAEEATDNATPTAAAVTNADAAIDNGADEIERATVLRLVQEQIAARSLKTSAFASKATRELALLQSSTARAYALISVRFPDGVQLQARYITERDTVQSVVDVITHSFVSEQHGEFELYLTAPMRTLSSAAVLHDVGIRGHANLVHLRWLSDSDSSSENDDDSSEQQCVGNKNSDVAVAADTMLLLRPDLTTMSVREARQQRYDVPAAVPLVLDKLNRTTRTTAVTAAATAAATATTTAAVKAAAATTVEPTANGDA
jgi:UBX domain